MSENRCVKLSERIPLDVAVLFGCAIPTGAGIVINEVTLRKEDAIAIFVLGGIGLSALMATRLFECQTVIAVDVEDDKLKLAKEFGATHTVNSAKENPIEAVRQITDGRGVDYSIEAAGMTLTIEHRHFRGGSCSRWFMCFCVASQGRRQDKSLTLTSLSAENKSEGPGGNCNPDRDIPRFAQLYREGNLPLEKLLSHRYSLNNINQALDDLKERRITRALIEINEALLEIPFK